MRQKLIFTNNPAVEIDKIVSDLQPSTTFVITDKTVMANVIPQLKADSRVIKNVRTIVCDSGDINKNIDSVVSIWKYLSGEGATRKSLVLNVGGGMITDMGGFAAATFKRGVRFVNIPTTLLGAVDASVGGKTGVNFNGLKNEVGAFAQAEASVISTVYFSTLPDHELLSGYAEMLKHALLKDVQSFVELLSFDPAARPIDYDRLLSLLEKSVDVKRNIVELDPYEHGLRKALNFGHTIGHAFESFAMKNGSPISHGYAVAWGLLVELILSHMKFNFPSEQLYNYATFVKENYGTFLIDCDDYEILLELMSHDKKNSSPDRINFSMLRSPGDVVIDCCLAKDDIVAAFDIYRDLLGI